MDVGEKIERKISSEFLKALKKYLKEDKMIEDIVSEIKHWKDIFNKFGRTINVLHYYVNKRKELEKKIFEIMKNLEEIKKKKEGETKAGQELLRKLFLTLILLKYLYDMNLLDENAKKTLREISGIFAIEGEDKKFRNLVTALFQGKSLPKVNLREINGEKFLEVSGWGLEELYILGKVFGGGEIDRKNMKFIIPFKHVEELVRAIGWILPRYIEKRLEDVQRASVRDVLLSMGIKKIPEKLGELSNKVFEKLFRDLKELEGELGKIDDQEKELKKELKNTLTELSDNLKLLGNTVQILSLFWILAILESGETIKEDILSKISEELSEEDIKKITENLDKNLEEASRIATLYLVGIRRGWIDISEIFGKGKEKKIVSILRELSLEKLGESSEDVTME